MVWLAVAGNCHGSIHRIQNADRDFWVFVKLTRAQAICDQPLGGSNGQTLDRNAADEGQLHRPVRTHANGRDIVRLLKQRDGDKVARR